MSRARRERRKHARELSKKRNMPIFQRWQIHKRARGFFHWQYSGVLIGIFWTGALGVFAIATAVGGLTGPLFLITHIFFALALIWTLGYWLTRDTGEMVQKKVAELYDVWGTPLSLEHPHRRSITTWIGSCVFVAVYAICAYTTDRKSTR